MLTIEIFSDVICPWCYIGKRRLDQVLNSDTGEGSLSVGDRFSYIRMSR